MEPYSLKADNYHIAFASYDPFATYKCIANEYSYHLNGETCSTDRLYQGQGFWQPVRRWTTTFYCEIYITNFLKATSGNNFCVSLCIMKTTGLYLSFCNMWSYFIFGQTVLVKPEKLLLATRKSYPATWENQCRRMDFWKALVHRWLPCGSVRVSRLSC